MAEFTTMGSDESGNGQTGGTPDGASAGGAGTGDGGQPTNPGGGPAPSGNGGQDPNTSDVVYDPDSFKKLVVGLPDNVQQQVNALHKQLLADYTKKTQSVSEIRKQADAYKAFQQDPHGTLQQVAKQLGYELSKPGQGANNDPAGNGKWSPDNGDPQSWQDVVGYISQSIEGKFNQMLNPVLSEFQTVKRQSIESQLSEIDPSWKTYEDQMKDNLTKHPSMANDPATLYRISVPPEVLESRATQRALKKMEDKAKGGQLSGASTTNQRPRPGGEPDKPLSFADAVTFARKKLADEGILPR